MFNFCGSCHELSERLAAVSERFWQQGMCKKLIVFYFVFNFKMTTNAVTGSSVIKTDIKKGFWLTRNVVSLHIFCIFLWAVYNSGFRNIGHEYDF